MHMCVDDVRDPHVLAGGERHVGVHIVCARIDDGALAECPATEEIRGAPAVEVVEGPEDHGFLASIETLFTPHFAVAFCARSEMKRYSTLSSIRSTRKPADSIALR
jgi:hypothetical protein